MRIARWLAPCVLVAALVWAGWPGRAAGTPATLIRGADALATLGLMAIVPRFVARRCGPCGSSVLARSMRIGGSAAVLAIRRLAILCGADCHEELVDLTLELSALGGERFG